MLPFLISIEKFSIGQKSANFKVVYANKAFFQIIKERVRFCAHEHPKYKNNFPSFSPQKLLFWTPFPTFYNHSIEVGSTCDVRFSYSCAKFPVAAATAATTTAMDICILAKIKHEPSTPFPTNFHGNQFLVHKLNAKHIGESNHVC